MGHFVFTLDKDNLDSATRCLQFAKVAYDKGHQVDLFFYDDGVLWADKTRDLKTSSRTGDSPGDYLPYLVENEVPIGV